jgi:hypothetical protein
MMARIGKADHARILQLVDVEGMKVAEVATEYGCTPAKLYALLGKLRRAPTLDKPTLDKPMLENQGREDDAGDMPAAAAAVTSGAQDASLPLPVPAATTPLNDLFSTAAAPLAPPAPPAQAAPAPPSSPGNVTALPLKGPVAKKSGVGASLAKPGYGLAMRTAEGEENVTPFRSLEDLLSMVKPMLRAAARSPDAVWFSIRQIDLSMVDYDAA